MTTTTTASTAQEVPLELVDPEHALTLVGDGYTLQLAAPVEQARALLIAAGDQITEVSDQAGVDRAVQEIRAMREFERGIEAARQLVKRPILDLGNEIQAKARDFVVPLVHARMRLEHMVAEFAAIEAEANRQAEEEALQQAQAAEKARQAEDAKIRAAQKAQEDADRRAAQAKAQQEAAARAAAEATSRQARAHAAAQQAKADAAAQVAREAQAKADARVTAAARAAVARETQEAKSAELTFAASAPPVAQVKQVLDFTVEDPHALYAADRALCEVIPKRREILARLARMQDLDPRTPPQIPGLRVFVDHKVASR